MTKILKNKKILSVFALIMINVALICSLRGLPTMAEYGTSIIFFLLAGVVIFLVPSSLVSAELATSFSKRGGIYLWVKEALGSRWGFMAIWLQWIQNIVFYPTALAATAATIAYIFMPSLASNPIYTVIIILVVYWGATLLNFKGLKVSAWFSSFGTITGIIIPGLILIGAAVAWSATGHPLQISLDWQSIMPDFSNINNLVFFSGVLLFFAGMEVSAVHAKEVKNPQKDFPRAILFSAVIIVLIFLFGSLAIAAVIPAQDISLTAGIMQTFMTIFEEFGLKWIVPIIALLAAPGMIAQISTWIAGPSKGLLATADDGNLPPFFQHINKNGVQTHILFTQGCIVTVISLIFLLMPTVSSSFWILTALAAQLYLLMYFLLFVSAIKLRYSRPDLPRPFKVPGGNAGMWFFGLLGICAAIIAIVLGFFPPSQLQSGGTWLYDAFLITGIVLMAGAPLVIYHFRKPHWKRKISHLIK